MCKIFQKIDEIVRRFVYWIAYFGLVWAFMSWVAAHITWISKYGWGVVVFAGVGAACVVGTKTKCSKSKTKKTSGAVGFITCWIGGRPQVKTAGCRKFAIILSFVPILFALYVVTYNILILRALFLIENLPNPPAYHILQ